VVFQRAAVAADYAADDEERDAGSCGAAEEEGTTANFVNEQEGGERGQSVD